LSTIKKWWNKIAEIAHDELNANLEYDSNDQISAIVFNPASDNPIKHEWTLNGAARSLEIILNNFGINPYAVLRLNDTELTSYIELTDAGSGVASLDILDKHLTYSKSLLKNHVRIYDITRS